MEFTRRAFMKGLAGVVATVIVPFQGKSEVARSVTRGVIVGPVKIPLNVPPSYGMASVSPENGYVSWDSADSDPIADIQAMKKIIQADTFEPPPDMILGRSAFLGFGGTEEEWEAIHSSL